MGLFQSRPAQQPLVAVPYASPSPTGSTGSMVVSVLGGILLIYLGLVFFNYIQRRNGQPGITLFDVSKSSGDKTPTPVDGKTKTVIPAGEIPIGVGADYGHSILDVYLQLGLSVSDRTRRF